MLNARLLAIHGRSANRSADSVGGLRPIQIWVPDVRSPDFAAEAHRQARLVADSRTTDADQDFIDAISEWPGK